MHTNQAWRKENWVRQATEVAVLPDAVQCEKFILKNLEHKHPRNLGGSGDMFQRKILKNKAPRYAILVIFHH